MAKLFERLRLWLIKKLGGYTEQKVKEVYRPSFLSKEAYHKTEVCAELDINRSKFLKLSNIELEELENCFKKEARVLLMQELDIANKIIYESTEDYKRGVVTLRASLTFFEKG